MPDYRLQPPPNDLRFPLHRLRQHYLALAEEYEQKATVARDRASTVEGMLADFEENPYADCLP